MSTSRIILASLPSFCKKLSKLVERESDENKFAQFLRYGVLTAPVVLLVIQACRLVRR